MMLPISARVAKVRKSRPTKATPAPAKTPTPTAPIPAVPAANTFYSFMHQIRTMNSDDVIDNQGIFTDTFKNFIQSSNLASPDMEALMQAGRNLHLPLSGDSKRDIALTAHAGKNIDSFMAANLIATIPSTPIIGATKTSPIIVKPVTTPIQTIPTSPASIPKNKPIAGKPLVPQIPTTTGAVRINKPIPPMPDRQPQPQQALPQNINIDDLSDQVLEDLESMHQKNKIHDIFIPDNNDPLYGYIDVKNPKTRNIIDQLIRNLINKYPSASAENVVEAIQAGMRYFASQLGNDSKIRFFSVRRFRIDKYITDMFKKLTPKNISQQVSPQPQPRVSAQNQMLRVQTGELVRKKLIEMNQKEPLDNLFAQYKDGTWYLQITNTAQGAFNTPINSKAQTVVDNLVLVLHDTYPNNISENSLDFVYDTIIAGMQDFLRDKYQKKPFEDIDSMIYDYLSSGSFKRIMSQKPQTE